MKIHYCIYIYQYFFLMKNIHKICDKYIAELYIQQKMTLYDIRILFKPERYGKQRNVKY